MSPKASSLILLKKLNLIEVKKQKRLPKKLILYFYNFKKKRSNMKKYLAVFSFFLCSCASKPSPTQIIGKLNIYQPSIIVLEEGKQVETKEGFYIPQTEEVWHSDKRFRELERRGY